MVLTFIYCVSFVCTKARLVALLCRLHLNSGHQDARFYIRLGRRLGLAAPVCMGENVTRSAGTS